MTELRSLLFLIAVITVIADLYDNRLTMCILTVALFIADLRRSFRESNLHVEAVSQDGKVVLSVVEVKAVSDNYAISTFTDRAFREVFTFTAFADDFVSDVVCNFDSLILDVFVQLFHLSLLFEGFSLSFSRFLVEFFVQFLNLSHLL